MPMNKPIKLTKSKATGFSLVELLVYIGSMTLVLLALAYVLGSTYGIYTSMASASRADRAASTLAQVLSTELRSGATVDQANSVFNTPQGQLTIDAFDGVSEIEKVFSLDNGRVLFSFDSEDTYMTPADMEVSKFLFTQITTPISYAIRFEIDLTYVAGGELQTRTYPGVVVLKRSYD